MTCDDFDKLLHPYVDREFDNSERDEADRHLAACLECTRKVQFERQFRLALRAGVEGDGAPGHRAPESLRMSVLSGISREHRRKQSRSMIGVASAAAVIMAVGSTVWVYWPKERERFLSDAAERHARSLPTEIQAGAHEEVEAWFGGKLDHRVRVPRFQNAHVAGARLSNVQERPAAYIRYQKPDKAGTPRTIGLFVFGDSDHDVEAKPLPSVELDQRLGYNVAIWRDGEIVYEMVTDLDENDIRALLMAQQDAPSAPAAPEPVQPAPSIAPATRPALDVRPVSLQ